MFNKVIEFEKQISKFFGSPYAVATDCCTHAVELCLRHTSASFCNVPNNTYLSIPMTIKKLNIPFQWVDIKWKDYYYITSNIYDAAVLWEANSYITNSFMCISFQHSKHLSLGKGGVILCPTLADYKMLKAMSYDGRDLSIVPWADQDVSILGYHYYMTPETAQLGLDKLAQAIATKPRSCDYTNYPDISKMSVFNDFK